MCSLQQAMLVAEEDVFEKELEMCAPMPTAEDLREVLPIVSAFPLVDLDACKTAPTPNRTAAMRARTRPNDVCFGRARQVPPGVFARNMLRKMGWNGASASGLARTPTLFKLLAPSSRSMLTRSLPVSVLCRG